jgi:hypothetical protein
VVRVDTGLAAPARTAADHQWALTGQKKSRPVVWWAAVGAFFVIVQVGVYASWILQGDAYPQTMGPDTMDAGAKFWAWLLQGLSASAGLWTIFYLARRSFRQKGLAWDSFIAIAFFSVYWQDTIINYLRPIFLYNSYMVNLGAWNPHIPGWISPNARNTPEPLLLIAPVYVWWFVLFAVAFCGLAKWAQRRWPNIGKAGIFMLGVLVLGLMDTLLEGLAIRTGLFAYSGVIRELSIWPGKTYQFPIYEGVIVGVFCSIIGMIRYTRDDKGYSVIERGSDQVRVTGRKLTVIRALAWIGLANTMFVILNVGYNWIGLYADTTPKYPSYMLNGICGPDTDVECPAPGVPIVFPETKLPLPK